MRIAFHLGAHTTDEDQLIKSLLKNIGILSKHGVVVPGPSRYRSLIPQVLNKLAGEVASAETQDVLFESIMDIDHAERLVLSHDNFLGASRRAFEHGELYHLAARNATRLRNLFPDHEVEFFIGIRDIATFLPAVFEANSNTDFTEFMAGIDPHELFWSDVVEAIRDAVPGCPITVWCNEDTPLIWPEVMHELAGLEPQVRLMGGFDILSGIMEKEGMSRLRTYLKTHKPQNEIQRRRILAAFLDKYALEDEIEEELDLPGWTYELTEDLTSAYDDDVLEITRLPGVTFLTA